MDYKIELYSVAYTVDGTHYQKEKVFQNEEDAVKFINDTKEFWSAYSMYKVSRAII